MFVFVVIVYNGKENDSHIARALFFICPITLFSKIFLILAAIYFKSETMCKGAFNYDLIIKIYHSHSNHESNYTSHILSVINFVSKFLYKNLIIFKFTQTIHIE